MTWADVDLEARSLRVRGTLSRVDGQLVTTATNTDKSRRTIPLTAAAVDCLRDVKARQRREQLAAGSKYTRTAFVFASEFGAPADPRNALRALHAAARAAGLPATKLHTLRHTAASALLTAGVPLKVVSEVLGHSSIAITGDIYSHVSPELARDAMDRLGDVLGA